MKRKAKLKVCKACGQEIALNAKICPNCGVKNKNPLFKKWWFWLLILFIFIGALSSGDSEDNTTTPPPTSSEIPSASTEDESIAEEPEEETPDIELSTNFENSVYEIVKNASGKLVSIETIESDTNDETSVIASILCENDENVVNAILSEISNVVKANDTNESVIFTFGDIEEGDEAGLLVMAGIYSDGTIDVSTTSSEYNSERNRWIQSQFSVWDGAHKELEKLIVRNLNDEKSYEHIDTTYRDIATESDRDDVNKVLADAGYSQRVEVGDLFIQTVFSAKNAFGGTIKNTAFGIASYNNNTITLIDMG